MSRDDSYHSHPDPRGICNACGIRLNSYYIRRECIACHQGEIIHDGFWCVSDCPVCKGKEGHDCRLCGGLGFTAMPSEDQETIDRACSFHGNHCINPWKWWKEMMKEIETGSP